MEDQIKDRFKNYGVCELHKIELDHNCLRYYRIEVMPGLFSLIVSRFWGRIGQTPRCKEVFLDSIEEGIKLANNLYRQKCRRGYTEIGMWPLNKEFELDNDKGDSNAKR